MINENKNIILCVRYSVKINMGRMVDSSGPNKPIISKSTQVKPSKSNPIRPEKPLLECKFDFKAYLIYFYYLIQII